MPRRSLPYMIVICSSLFVIGFVSALTRQSVSGVHATGSTPILVFLPVITRQCATTQLLQDGDFEAGLPNPYWKTASNRSSSILDNSSIPQPNPTHSGAWKAWLGGDNNVQESLWQTITVPSGTASLQVSIWWLVNTNEPSPLVNDRLDVQLRDATSATILATLYTLYDGDANTVWQQKVISTSPYAGQTIQIAFVADTDASNPTNFFIDDVSVMACR